MPSISEVLKPSRTKIHDLVRYLKFGILSCRLTVPYLPILAKLVWSIWTMKSLKTVELYPVLKNYNINSIGIILFI